MFARLKAAGACALALSFCLGAGCNSGKSEVKGKVTYQGKPVVWGTVTLVDASGQYHQSPIDLGGNYAVSGVPEGKVKIAVSSPNPHAGGARGKAGGGPGAKGAEAKGAEASDPEDPRSKFKKESAPEQPRPEKGKWFAIPADYGDPTTTKLTGEVKRGQPLDIDLK